eukprot:9443354-Pyramimonas_sp.AAC.1
MGTLHVRVGRAPPRRAHSTTTLVKINLKHGDHAPAMSARPSMSIDAPPISGPGQKWSDQERLG